MYVRSTRPIRQNIWRYLTEWSHIKAPLNGNDLKALGYKPGKQFKEILDALLTAILDDQIDSCESAEAFVAEHFPLNK